MRYKITHVWSPCVCKSPSVYMFKEYPRFLTYTFWWEAIYLFFLVSGRSIDCVAHFVCFVFVLVGVRSFAERVVVMCERALARLLVIWPAHELYRAWWFHKTFDGLILPRNEEVIACGWYDSNSECGCFAWRCIRGKMANKSLSELYSSQKSSIRHLYFEVLRVVQ